MHKRIYVNSVYSVGMESGVYIVSFERWEQLVQEYASQKEGDKAHGRKSKSSKKGIPAGMVSEEQGQGKGNAGEILAAQGRR